VDDIPENITFTYKHYIHIQSHHIQSDLHCEPVFFQHRHSLGIGPMTLALLASCCTVCVIGRLHYCLVVRFQMLALKTLFNTDWLMRIRTQSPLNTILYISVQSIEQNKSLSVTLQ